MTAELGSRFLESLVVLERVCRNQDIMELSQDSPEWSNVLNDSLSLAKRVAGQVEAVRSLEQDQWERFMDVICSESKAPGMLSETLSILKAPLQSETVLSIVSDSVEFQDCLTALRHLAESIENHHMSGSHLGEHLWKELRAIVQQNGSELPIFVQHNDWELQAFNSNPRPEKSSTIPTLKEKLLNMPLEEKRKLYSCKSKFKTLADIPSWREYAETNGVAPAQDPLYPVHGEMNEKISFYEEDIVTLEVDAIVTSADTALLARGILDDVVRQAAGPGLAKECLDLKGVEMGRAKITGGYLLPARYVIHTAGPRGKNSKMLENCYNHCLKLVLDNRLKTVAFPCISTGGYGYPSRLAAMTVLKTVRDFLQVKGNLRNVERIIFCVMSAVNVTVYKELLPAYFPV